jgi:uncharacterized protein with HEPN domain
MSSREWSLRIRDILSAIESIQKYTEGMTQTEFEANEIVLRAVLYNFIVIGEAAINIPSEIRLYSPELPWRLMGDLRNIVAHEYFRVDSEIVWDTLKNNLPELVDPLRHILEKEKKIEK